MSEKILLIAISSDDQINVIAPAGRPHLVKFYFSTGRPERRAYILVPDLHGVHSSNSVHYFYW